VTWAARREFVSHEDLADGIVGLVAECPRCPPSVHVTIEREIVQLRTLVPAPPVPAGRAGAFAVLESSRLFRGCTRRLITDAAILRVPGVGCVLYVGAAEEALCEAIVHGCEAAGLRVCSLGPASDVLSRASAIGATGSSTFKAGGAVEKIEHHRYRVWRSRLLPAQNEPLTPLTPAFAALGADFAAAAASTREVPTLSMLPPTSRVAKEKAARRRTLLVGAAGLALWIAAGVLFSSRLRMAAAGAERDLAVLRPQVQRLVRIRDDLAAATAAVASIREAGHRRSRHLVLLGTLASLPDSMVVFAVHSWTDSIVRIGTLAPSAAGAIAAFERMPAFRGPRLEGVIVRQAVHINGKSRDWDRFTIRASMGSNR